jgi:hypothetical protein
MLSTFEEPLLHVYTMPKKPIYSILRMHERSLCVLTGGRAIA